MSEATAPIYDLENIVTFTISKNIIASQQEAEWLIFVPDSSAQLGGEWIIYSPNSNALAISLY